MFTRLLHTIQSYIMSKEPEPGPGPEPTHNYVLLQNFVDGHTIGTPVDYSQVYGGWVDHWIDTVLYDDSNHEDYVPFDNYGDIWKLSYKDNLVSTAVGSKMIDTRNPVDFSNYQISNGTPYGIFNGNDDETATSLNFNLSDTTFNPGNTTIESWIFARCDSYGTISISPIQALFSIGSDNVRESGAWIDGFQIVVCAEDDYDGEGISVRVSYRGIDDSSFSLMTVFEDENEDFIDSGTTFRNWLQSWHHYALGIDGNNIYLHLDGKLVAQRALSDVITFEYDSTEYNGPISGIVSQIPKWVQIGCRNWNTATFDGGYAQVAVADSCKWNSDFTPPTTAYA